MKNIITGSLLFVVLLFTSCSGSGSSKPEGQAIAPGVIQLRNKQVCMVNDRYFNKDQMPVPVNNKVYYGCCAACVGALQNNTASRYAPDALTQEKVDKATAVIIPKPGTEDGVLYFASATNAIKYMQRSTAKK